MLDQPGFDRPAPPMTPENFDPANLVGRMKDIWEGTSGLPDWHAAQYRARWQGLPVPPTPPECMPRCACRLPVPKPPAT